MSVAARPSAPQYSPAVQTGPIDGPMILLEFNELSPALMDTFIEQGYLPNFKRLRDGSQVFTTVAEEVAPNLDPWIQWVTVHSGLSFDEHGIFHLGDGHKLAVKSLWDMIAARGKTVWVCGSMNIKYDTPVRGAVVPDPWTVGVSPSPAELEPYYLFVQRNVQEYTNDRVPLSKADYLRFLKFMVTHGLSVRTGRSILSQLWGERRTGKGKWKRATILDKLQRDVFLHYFRKLRPAFSTFFLNSTAHFQHAHWRNMDPEPFKIKPTDDDQAEYQHAVRYGYEEMDSVDFDSLPESMQNQIQATDFVLLNHDFKYWNYILEALRKGEEVVGVRALVEGLGRVVLLLFLEVGSGVPVRSGDDVHLSIFIEVASCNFGIKSSLIFS